MRPQLWLTMAEWRRELGQYTAARQAIAGFASTDTFSIAAEDPTGLQSDPVVVAVVIEEINDPPTVSADPATVPEDGVVVIALTGQDPGRPRDVRRERAANERLRVHHRIAGDVHA